MFIIFGRFRNTFLYYDMTISDIHFYKITYIKSKPFQILTGNSNEWMSLSFVTIVLIIYLLSSLHYCFHSVMISRTKIYTQHNSVVINCKRELKKLLVCIKKPPLKKARAGGIQRFTLTMNY